MTDTAIQLRYMQRQDRIFARLPLNDTMVEVWLTRRLTARMLKAFADILSKPAPAPQDAPAEAAPAAPVAERHRDAISAARTAPPVPASDTTEAETNPAEVREPVLIQELKLARMGQAVVMLVPVRDTVMRLALSEADLLRFVDMLYRKSVEAGWDLESSVPWLRDNYFGAEAEARRNAAN